MYVLPESASIACALEPGDGYYNEKAGQAKNYTVFEVNKLMAGMTATSTLYVEILICHTQFARLWGG